MKERPILFSAPMVKAIQEGKKTQTRRVMRDQPDDDGYVLVSSVSNSAWVGNSSSGGICARITNPYGAPGDQLWVRETHYYDIPIVDFKVKPDDYDPLAMYYRADGECCDQIPECQCFDVGKTKWRPSIFMPRWASRIQLRITDVRVERLQDISREDALAEGIERTDWVYAKKHPWESNPWVWVVEFEAANTDRSDHP